MRLDPTKNFHQITLETGINSSATSMTVLGADVPNLIDPAVRGDYNLVIWNATDYQSPYEDPDREIVRVTAISGQTVTIQRPAVGNDYNGEGDENTPKSHNTVNKVYVLANVITRKMIEDMADNFSFKEIASGEEIVIPSGQQMLLEGDMVLDGDIEVDGEIVFIDEPIYEPSLEWFLQNLGTYPYAISRDGNGFVSTVTYTTPFGEIVKTINRDGNNRASSIVLSGDVPHDVPTDTKSLTRTGASVSSVAYSDS